MSKVAKKAVVITTEHKGVFFGYVLNDKKAPTEITLKQARMCVYWSSDVKGVMGLASNGPTSKCRITHAVPKFTGYKITGILECSPQAIEAWEKGAWS